MMILKSLPLIIFTIHLECHMANKLLHLDHQTLMALEERGKIQLDALKEKTHHPQYGECWIQSLNFLHEGCRMLSENVHIDIALRFTNCFMEMSGQADPLECLSERTVPLRRLCMSQMTDRAFSVYTEFFTQTQSMCYFLQNQVWHHETERSINRLSSFSRAAGEQLELMSSMQDALLQQQRDQYRQQAELLDIGRNLSVSLESSHLTLERLTTDLRKSTEQHSAVLEELFREFHQLHRWIVGRYAFVDGLLFYCSYLTILLILTSLKRTVGARAFLLAFFMMSICIEWCLHKQSIVSDSVSLDFYRWVVRQTSLICSFIALVYCAYNFSHFSHLALVDIREQNRLILKHLAQMKLPPDDRRSHFLSSPTNEHVTTNRPSVRIVRRITERIGLQVVEEHSGGDGNEMMVNNPNMRRSVSRTSYISAHEQRDGALSSGSTEKHFSRYNLRRKSVTS